MVKIYCLTPELNNGASIPRVNSIKHMEETGYPVTVQVATEIAPYNIDWADIVFIHRPIHDAVPGICQQVKGKNKKLWIDNDDDQLSLPLDHPRFLMYNDQKLKDNIIEANKMADVVTISNEAIRNSYGHLNNNIQYYPCAYDERLMPDISHQPRTKTILWRGSATHSKSLEEFSTAIGNVDKKFNGWNFVFIGHYPWQVLEKITQNKWSCSASYMPTERMWYETRAIAPAIQMVCLTDNQFTRSRSNMAMIDGTIAGAKILARDWDHWKTPGVSLYKNVEDFEYRLGNLMKQFESYGTFEDSVKDAWNYIQENQTFNAINKHQFKIVKELCGEKL